MSRKRALIYTILFAIAIIGIVIAMMYIKPYDGDISLFHAFAPFPVGLWLADLIDKFYRWLRNKK